MKNQYRLIDSGDNQKLEFIGKHKIIRASIGSMYHKKKPDLWKNADAEYIKNETGSGTWKFQEKIPDSIEIELKHGIVMKLKLTPFGHIGIFPEQEKNWELIYKIGRSNPDLEVLNLFAYSGASTIFALKSGMSVCHVDASKGMVDWAMENCTLSGVRDMKVRFIVDDVIKFLRREVNRGKHYHGVILDPPSFGRGAKGEVWKIEKDLPELMSLIEKLTKGKPEFMILTCHSTGFSPIVLERILGSHIQIKGEFQNEELFIREEAGGKLSGGFCARFLSEKLLKDKSGN
ncbi:MAG: class I SAM-dependent methyltransferase [Leptospiraceae bacterium]|nr:class I SAM-dependent methyltransferase [Leptospiraceae bacterium]